MIDKTTLITGDEEITLPQNIQEVEERIAYILSQYGSRQMAYIVVSSLLDKIPLQLAKDWLQSRKIVTQEDLKKKLAYLQAKHRRFHLEVKKREVEKLQSDYEAWLFQKD